MNNDSLLAYMETIGLTVGLIALFFYLNPADPLLLHASFPWVWMIPALLALRHGRLPGAISAGILLLAMLYTIFFLAYSWDTYQLWLLGGLTLTLICSEFHALWMRRQYALNEKTDYLDKRIESLSRAYGVLRLSHDRLEETLIIRPRTLRQSLIELRRILTKAQDKLNPEIASEYLDLLADHAGLDSASLYLLRDKHWDIEPIAHIGKKEPLMLNDKLVKHCLSKRRTAYVAVNMLEKNEMSAYLAVVPMETSDDYIMGLLTISEMAFLALNEETLKKLNLLLAYIADETQAARSAPELQKYYPDCPSMFASEVYKLEHLWKTANIDSAVAAFYLQPCPKRDDIIFLFIQQKRALDVIWQTKRNDVIILIVLMPLTQRSMLAGYLQRIQMLLKHQEDVVLGESPIFLQHRQLSAYPTITLLLEDLLKNANNF